MHHAITRRAASSMAAVLALAGWTGLARAQALASLSDGDASKGLKTALELGAAAAVQLLGRPDGFLGNPQVRIPLPGHLRDVAKLLAATGLRRQVEELETAMNRAAEAAVPQAAGLLRDAVRKMTVDDARRILTGGDTSVTEFFASRTREPLTGTFLPVVRQATSKVELAGKYDRVAGRAAGLGLLKPEDASMDHYVTRKALDGLYFAIGEQEKKFRRDPLGSGNAIIGKVFGALR